MPREELNTTGLLRRVRLDLNTLAELAIFKAMQEVEKAGADIRLTEATTLLAKAKDLVADFVDGVEPSLPPADATAEEIIEARIKHFNNNYHTFEGKELQAALDTIKRLVPPEQFAAQRQPTAEDNSFIAKVKELYGDGVIIEDHSTPQAGTTAEEILTKHMSKLPAEYVTFISQYEKDRHQFVIDAMQEFATLHAQRIADKKYADTEADGYVFCGKCGKVKEI